MIQNKKIFQVILAVFSVFMISGVFATATTEIALANTKTQVQDGVKEVGGPNSGDTSGDQVTVVIKNVIGIISFLVGLVAVLMIVIAGFRFVTSNGDAGTVSSAKNTIIYAVIGLIITIMAYAIVNFILDNLT